jgi:hypothetical protein
VEGRAEGDRLLECGLWNDEWSSGHAGARLILLDVDRGHRHHSVCLAHEEAIVAFN